MGRNVTILTFIYEKRTNVIFARNCFTCCTPARPISKAIARSCTNNNPPKSKTISSVQEDEEANKKRTKQIFKRLRKNVARGRKTAENDIDEVQRTTDAQGKTVVSMTDTTDPKESSTICGKPVQQKKKIFKSYNSYAAYIQK